MKLQRLAGFGPVAAYVSAVSLLVFLFLQEAGTAIATAAPNMFVPLAIVFTLAMSLWVVGLAVVVLDLEWYEHPKTSSRWIRVAQIATLVALPMPLLVNVAPFTPAGVDLQSPSFFLLYAGVGISLLVHNIEGRRTGLLHRVLPWIGIAVAVCYLVAAIGFGTFLVPGIGMITFMVGFNVQILGEILYIVWAIWMGVRLSRTRATVSAIPQPAAG